VAGAKRAVAPSSSTLPAKRPYRGVWKPRFVPLSLFFLFFFVGASFSYYPFLPRSSPFGMATMMVMAAADAVVGETLWPAPDGEPRTPERVPEDMVESEGEPEVAPEPVLEVVPEEAPTEGP
jgi:hypothetical protein